MNYDDFYNKFSVGNDNSNSDTATTPVDNNLLYDNTQSQYDSTNPFAVDYSNATDNVSGASADVDVDKDEDKNKDQNVTEQAAAENNQAASEQPAQPQESFSQEALNNILAQNGVTADEWNRITQPGFDVQGLMSSTSPDAAKYQNAIMAYYNMAQTPAQPQNSNGAVYSEPIGPKMPEQQALMNSSAEAPKPNTYVDPNGIYDASKQYGRQGNGDYVYSNSARDLQNQLAQRGYYKGAIDGYFGVETQSALDAYLADNGVKVEDDKGSETVTQSAQEAPKEETPSNVEQAVQNSTGNSNNPAVPSTNASSSRPAHDDAWYAAQYEKITGSAPRTDILSPERIKDFVDKEMAKSPTTPEDEGYDAMLQQKALYEQAQEQQRINEMNARRDDAFTPKFINDLRNGKSVDQILGEGDLSYNRWIQDNWDDLSYTYNLGSESPFESQPKEQREPINYAAMLDELNQMDRNDWYQRPESQATTQREPINYNAMADELAQLERNDWYQRPESQSASAPERTPINYDAMSNELFQMDRNDWYQRPDTPQAPDRTPLEYSDAFIRQQDMNDSYSPRQSFNDNYRTQLEQLQREPIEYSDAFIRQEEMKDAYSPNADYSGSMSSDDIQSSSGTSSSDEQAMREAYEAAMQSAGRARDIFQGLPTSEAEQMQQAREQWQQNMRTALEDQFNNPYMQQFRNDFEALQRQFPNYSYSALADMVLFNEEMRNGQSSYYKWLSNQL